MASIKAERLTPSTSRETFEEIEQVYSDAYAEAGITTEALENAVQSQQQEWYALKLDKGDSEDYIAAVRVKFEYENFGAEISEAAVKPELQGKGIGKTVFGYADNRAEELSNGKVYTWTSTKNPGAQALATSEGYIPAGVEIGSIPPGADEPVENIFLINPGTVNGGNRTVYTTGAAEHAINEFLHDTELGDAITRDIEQIESNPKSETAYMVSTEKGSGGNVTFGLRGVNDTGGVTQNGVHRSVNHGTMEEALETDPFGIDNMKVAVNLSDPSAAASLDYLVNEQGYTPLAFNPEVPFKPQQVTEDDLVDSLILEQVDETREINTIDPVSEWLEELDIPVDPR